MKVNEILVLHHSHLDLGYTHPQPVLWRLQYDFIELALDFLKATKDWPEVSRPVWTCEVSFQVTQWLRYANDERIAVFREFVDQGRIGFGGFQYNTTPLCNYEQMVRQLLPLKKLRRQFGAKITTVLQHDVNGIPWSSGDLFLDSGIDTLIMGINAHQGGAPFQRPGVFRWQTPSGAELRVMNGEHYTMFDQLFNTSSGKLDEMQRGVEAYLERLEKQSYPHNFVYLTSTNIPVCWDNSPPNPETAYLIRQWNEEGRQPVIRYVTPDELGGRIHALANLHLEKGDWTDYWNFGCASSAYETALNRGTKGRLFTADFLAAVNPVSSPASNEARSVSWEKVNIYDEHTWGNDESMDHDHPETRSQWALKAAPAYEGRGLSEYSLIRELETLTKNPEQSNQLEGVFLFNPYPEARLMIFPVPEKWKRKGKKLGTARFRHDEQIHNHIPEDTPRYVQKMPGYSWAKIPFGELQKYSSKGLCSWGEETISSLTDMNGYDEIVVKEKKSVFIQSPYYKLVFDPLTGRITSLIDRILDREIIDSQSEYGFFQMVREIPDPQFDGSRTSYYERDLIKMRADESCWKTDWKAKRETPGKLTSYEVTEAEGSMTVTRIYEITGAKNIRQSITLPADIPAVELYVSFDKVDINEPESLYFTFPMNLESGWRGAFDSAGTSVELDAEQLSGSCRDWVTAESYVSLHDGECSVLLSSPHAPMAMFGDFYYGRKNDAIPRNKNPLLLSWPVNSYWQTNFRASQPGKMEFRYSFRSARSFSPYESRMVSKDLPLIVHPLVCCKKSEGERFLTLDDCCNSRNVELIHLKRGEDGSGFVIRLANHYSEKITVLLGIPGRSIVKAFECSPLEENPTPLILQENQVSISLKGRKVTTIKIISEEQI